MGDSYRVDKSLAKTIYPKLPHSTRDLINENELAEYIGELLLSTGDLESLYEPTRLGETHGFSFCHMSVIDGPHIWRVNYTEKSEQYVENLVMSNLSALHERFGVSSITENILSSTFQFETVNVALFDNPFYILEASITDNRRKIASLCEDKSLYVDSKICEEARTILITPQRRLSAEMHWFPDCGTSEIQALLSFIEDSKKDPDAESGSIAHLCALSQLNAYTGSFSGKEASTYQGLKRDILRISRLFEDLNSEEIRTLLNEKRTIAGFPQIESINDINSIIAEIRSEIRKTITQKLGGLNQEQYIEFVTTISESYSSKRNKGQAVLEDIIAEYELRINDALEEKAKNIIRMADFIAKGADKIDVDSALKDLLAALSSWDKLAQPMQLGALTKGDAHKESAEMFRKMRNLSLELNNTYHLSEQALTVNSAMQTVFAEMPEHLAMLKEDEKALKNLIQDKRAFDEFNKKTKTIEDLIAAAKNGLERYRREKITTILNETRELDTFIQNNLTGEEQRQTREGLGFMVRGLAIELANDKKDFDNGLYIVNELLRIFPSSVSSTLYSKLIADQTTLRSLVSSRVGYNSGSNSSSYASSNYSSSKSQGSGGGRIIFALFAVMGLILLYVFNSNSSGITKPTTRSTPKPSTYQSSTSSQSSTTSTTITFNKEGGTGGSSNVTAYNGSAMPSATAPTKKGYNFKGYYTSPDGAGIQYYDSNMKSARNWDSTYGVKTLYAYWEQVQEKIFTQNLSAGELAYIDVTSVFPSNSITTQRTTNGIKGMPTLTAMVLECYKQEKNLSKYVYISISDYKKYIDQNANEFDLQYSRTADEIYFTGTKRIHGTVRVAENMCDGLSKTTGKMLLEFSSIENISSSNASNSSPGNSVYDRASAFTSNLNRPKNGEVFYYRYADQPCELEIINKKDEDMYCKFVDENGNDTNRFYVRANSTANIPIPVGTYTLKFATGTTWYNETSLFGSGTKYYKDPETYTCSWGSKWTVTYYTSSGSGYSSTAPKTIPASAF